MPMMNHAASGITPAEQARRLMERRRRLAYQAENARKTCNVPACSKPRHNMGHYCRAHAGVRQFLGHAEARNITRRMTDGYEQRWQDFLERFPDHPAIKAGSQFLNALLADPKRFTRNQVIRDRVTGAWLRGARGPEMLQILAGVYLLSRYEPRVLPDDDRLRFLLAKRFISTWRKGRKHTTSSRDNAVKQNKLKRPTTTYRELGQLLHSYLGVLMDRVGERMDKDSAELRHFGNAVHEPFHTTAEIAMQQRFNLEDEESS